MDPLDYWNQRYRQGGTSGKGSQGKAVRRKARYINNLVTELGISSIVDWGCGDGELLSRLALDGASYIGVDISAEVIARLAPEYPRLTFVRMDTRNNPGVFVAAELALSVDTIFHLPDDTAYRRYLNYLFSSATRYVLVCSPNRDEDQHGHHLRYRRFADTVATMFSGWRLCQRPDRDHVNGFYLYAKDKSCTLTAFPDAFRPPPAKS